MVINLPFSDQKPERVNRKEQTGGIRWFRKSVMIPRSNETLTGDSDRAESSFYSLHSENIGSSSDSEEWFSPREKADRKHEEEDSDGFKTPTR